MAAEVPNRSLFKAPEVCEIAELQPYVLRSWEAEFPDLGVTRAGSPGRVYRRHDVERVLRLKHLLFVEGLTLAGARRRLQEESTPLPPLEEIGPAPRGTPGAADRALRRQLAEVQQGLRSLLEMLDRGRQAAPAFELHAEPAPRPSGGNGKSPRSGGREKPRAKNRRGGRRS